MLGDHGRGLKELSMKHLALRMLIAIALIAGGFAAGRAQTEPDFELVVDAPVGETTIECRRGCELAWVERGVTAAPQAKFTFKCGGPNQERCSSYRVGGWSKR
jgi:hypothetical protein